MGDSTETFTAEHCDLFRIKNAFPQHPRYYIIFNHIYANKALYVGNPKIYFTRSRCICMKNKNVRMECNNNINNNNKRCVHKSIPVNRTMVGW